MAIDSRFKRFNMLYVASPVAWYPQFEADGTVNADDRAHLLHLYGGNALSAPVPGVSIERFNPMISSVGKFMSR